jgi:hypothetical protein
MYALVSSVRKLMDTVKPAFAADWQATGQKLSSVQREWANPSADPARFLTPDRVELPHYSCSQAYVAQSIPPRGIRLAR